MIAAMTWNRNYATGNPNGVSLGRSRFHQATKRQIGAMLPAIVGCTGGIGTKYGIGATGKAHKWGKRPCHRVAETGKKEKGSQEATTNGLPLLTCGCAGIVCMKTKIFQAQNERIFAVTYRRGAALRVENKCDSQLAWKLTTSLKLGLLEQKLSHCNQGGAECDSQLVWERQV